MAKPKRCRPVPMPKLPLDGPMLLLGGKPRPLATHAAYVQSRLDALTPEFAKWAVERGDLKRIAKYLSCSRILTTRDEYVGEPGGELFTIGNRCRDRRLCRTCGVIQASQYAENRCNALPSLVRRFSLNAVIRFRAIETPEEALRATRYLNEYCLPHWQRKMRSFARRHGSPKVVTDRILGIHFGRVPPDREFLQPHLHLLAALPDTDIADAFCASVEQWIADANSTRFKGAPSPQFDGLQECGIKRIVFAETRSECSSKTLSIAHYRNLIAYVTRLTEENDEEHPADIFERYRMLGDAGVKKTVRSKRLRAHKSNAPNSIIYDPPLAVLTLDGEILRVHSHHFAAVRHFLIQQTRKFIMARLEQQSYVVRPLPIEWLVTTR